MEEIYELLDAVRARPKMYIGEDAMTNLWYLLDGYRMALSIHRDTLKIGHWDSEFNYFVAKRFPEIKNKFSKGYSRIILESVDGNELKALERFFALVDEFRAQESQK